MKGLRDSVEECLSSRLTREQRVGLYGRLMLYVFRGCVQADIRSWMAEQNFEFDFLGWRRKLHRNGQLLRNVKIFTYRRYCGFQVSPTEYEVSRAELAAIRLALDYPPLEAKLRDYFEVQRRHPLDLRMFDRFVERALNNPDIVSYIRKYIRKKMSFLEAYGINHRDIYSDLVSSSIFTLQKTYPRFDDVGHMVAIAKTALKNRGVNLMKEQTTKKRQKLIKNDDGTYQKNTIAISSVSGAVGDPNSVDSSAAAVASSFLVTGLDGAVQSSWERAFAMKQLRTSDALSARQKQFLGLMLGDHCSEFTAFLGKPNEEAVEELEHSEYLAQVCSFMNVPADKASVFLTSLGKVL